MIKILVRKLHFLAFLLLAAVVLQAQTSTPSSNPGADTPAPAGSESTQSNATPAASAQPAHSTGEGPQLAVESDPEYKNVLVGNVMGSASFDDHGLSSQVTPGVQVSDARFAVQPSLAFQQTWQKMNWTLSYTPGVSISQHDVNDYQYTQNAGGQYVWQPSSRFRLQLRQDYTVTTNPFESVGREPLLPTLGGFTGPTSNNLLPANIKREMMVSNAEVMTRLSPHSALGFTGGYQKYNYGDVAGSDSTTPLTLTASHTYLGTAFYSLQVSPDMTIGVQSAVFDIFSDLQFSAPSRTQAYDAQLFDAWKLSPRSILTIFAGPEYSRDYEPQLNLAISKHWRPEAGVTYAWNGSKNAFTLDYVRRISDGGGLMGSALTNRGAAGLRSQLSRYWGLEERLEASDQLEVQGLVEFQSYWAGIGLTRDLGRHLLFRLDYAHVRQITPGLASLPSTVKELLSLSSGDHNLVQFSVDYHFVKPVGR